MFLHKTIIKKSVFNFAIEKVAVAIFVIVFLVFPQPVVSFLSMCWPLIQIIAFFYALAPNITEIILFNKLIAKKPAFNLQKEKD